MIVGLLPGYAKEVELPAVVVSKTIEGIEINFPVGISASRNDPAQPVAVALTIDLSDFVAKVNTLIGAAWTKRHIDLDGKLTHNGTLLSIESPALRAKVHFHVRPGFVPSSNGSVVAYFVPTVADNRIALTGRITEFNISNDITRHAAEALNLDDLVRDKLGALLNEALSAPGAGLPLPPAVQALGVALSTASFVSVGGKPSLVVEGTLPAVAGLLLNL
ncbi:hypothetical protein EOA23_07275 [Mesorhizobium sp. M2A.F.Ca.ET.042.01.1.1]|uniref:hypothetical protein n=1 Tax=Mesorhizobium sp. M2A.F.Ca.ET.042.01.1.1 TaxID=2496745 RepID=UPI000FCAB92B|nr:hypothetical protein [Mesorhizobium sp. M2A.F.Ca.ET.042.01.1.1]RUX33322.1 hypothetical protein EOA23_07275 [Mesorhizobium sp. M2A.F.Ca.ET.042.01.1.1]